MDAVRIIARGWEDDQNHREAEEEEEEEELEEEDLDIPTPEEVEIEYTFPQDFDVHRSWRDIFLSPPWFGRRGEFFRLIIDPSCRKIPSGFFWQCTYLIEIVFPEKSCLAEIGQEAFIDCENLQRMNAFPVGLLRLRPRAFSCCISLSGKLVIPCTVVLMDHLCFSGCEAVTSIVFRDNLTQETDPVKLGNYVFANCSDLQSVRLPQNIVLIPPGTFSRCTALRNIPLPVSVEEIGIEAFLTCSSLPSIDLPQRTSRIGTRAYGECPSLVQVTIRTTEALQCGRVVFWQCPALVTIQVYPSLWTTLLESMNSDPSFLFHFIRKYQSYKWTA